MGNPNRKPSGTPQGGEWAEGTKAEADGDVADVLDRWTGAPGWGKVTDITVGDQLYSNWYDPHYGDTVESLETVHKIEDGTPGERRFINADGEWAKESTDHNALYRPSEAKLAAGDLVADYPERVQYIDAHQLNRMPRSIRHEDFISDPGGGQPDDTLPVLEVPHTSWSEVHGSDIDRANYEAIREQYELAVIHVPSGIGEGGSLYVDARHPDAAEVIGLLGDDHLVYDDDRLVQVESELATEAWDNYHRDETVGDITGVLVDRGWDKFDAEDAIDEYGVDRIRKEYFQAILDDGAPPAAESAIDVVWDERAHDQAVGAIARQVESAEAGE